MKGLVLALGVAILGAVVLTLTSPLLPGEGDVGRAREAVARRPVAEQVVGTIQRSHLPDKTTHVSFKPGRAGLSGSPGFVRPAGGVGPYRRRMKMVHRRVSGKTYTPSLKGAVVASTLAGVEPDGDPLYKVALLTRLNPSGDVPGLRLIVESYLENFKPDTTPVLPDLLHPNRAAQNLAGFLQGKVLLTDDAGNVLYLGSFVAEAFLDNSNHTAMHLSGSGAAFGAKASLLGSFVLRRDASLIGSLHGALSMPAAARRQVQANRGAKMKPLRDILRVVTVAPHPMVGRATGGGHSTPLPVGGYVQPSSGGTSRHISPWSIVAAIGAVLSLALAAVLYILERRKMAARAQS